MDSRSTEEGDSGIGDAEYYCRLALDGDRASSRIAGNRGKFESRTRATSRRYMDRSGDSGDMERRQQRTVDMNLCCRGEGPRKSQMSGRDY